MNGNDTRLINFCVKKMLEISLLFPYKKREIDAVITRLLEASQT
jgi:hypothetical protein